MLNLSCVKDLVIREVMMVFGCEQDKAILGIKRAAYYFGLFLIVLFVTGLLSTFFAAQNILIMSALFGFLFVIESFVFGVLTSLFISAITIYYITIIVKKAWYR